MALSDSPEKSEFHWGNLDQPLINALLPEKILNFDPLHDFSYRFGKKDVK